MVSISRWGKFLLWRSHHIGDRQFLLILSVIVGLAAGMAAVLLKHLVHLLHTWLMSGFDPQYNNFLFILYPIVGIAATVILIRYVIRREVGHGVPKVLYSISKSNGKMKRHNLYSSIVTGILTVGFGGSVGLEGPTIATGAAVGSQMGQQVRFDYQKITILISCASAAAMAAILKAPIAAIVIVLEVIMFDFTMASLVPILIASATGALTSYFFLGKGVLLPYTIDQPFQIGNFLYYIIFGAFGGLIAVYFTRVYKLVEAKFAKIPQWYWRVIIGGTLLGVLIFFLPSLYGEGYNSINGILQGNYSYLFENSIFYPFRNNAYIFLGLLLLVLIFKTFATSITFASGGVGGVFTPTLFMGANVGLFFVTVLGYIGINLPVSNFALTGMASLISGVLHAPLTGIFLIAEMTGGYELLLPLMICSTISYATVRMFESSSVYTYQLAKRGELMTHDKDKKVLLMMNVTKVIENDFNTVPPDANLGDLVKVVTESQRNIFPVVNHENKFFGIVKLDHIRHIMFDKEKYDSVCVRDLMYMPEFIIRPDEDMGEVVKKFQQSSRFTIPVLKDGRYYMGFVSRAKCFSAYQKMIKDFSED